MIIMDPHYWRRAVLQPLLLCEEMQGAHGLFRKFLIALDVRLPMVSDEGGPVRHGVEKWPESTIAAAIVVTVEEFRFCADRDYLK